MYFEEISEREIRIEVEPEEHVEEKVAEKMQVEDKSTVELVEVSAECIILILSHSFKK